MSTDGHGRLMSGELEERKCAYHGCDAHFECDKLSPKKYHSPRCSSLDAADKKAHQAKIKEAIRICKNQRCPQKSPKGTCGSRLAREGILVYCTRAECDYSFNVKLPGSTVRREEPVSDPAVVVDADSDGDADADEVAESEEGHSSSDAEQEDEDDEEGWGEEVDQGEDEGERILAELHQGSGLFTDPTPEVTQQQLVLLLAKLDSDTLAKVILTAKRLHAVIHTLKELS